ncbi:hypothetical protein L2E82_37264 [Cichorium intybus]|uniref:Uncharacterized protein n=1 Tax=Cichorium intybus TaxID=13427 RepID=A0ACB9AF75_CICIN|nr:hypothetical protein L2E82_37264 [Cichorium intybus]
MNIHLARRGLLCARRDERLNNAVIFNFVISAGTMSSSASSELIDWNSLATGVDQGIGNRGASARLPLGMDTEEMVQFRLGNHNRSCSLREFGYRIGLYTEEESEAPGFDSFHRRANYSADDSFSPADYWSTISSTRYHENTVREGLMHLPTHRMLHRLISTMIWPRADEDRITDEPLKQIALGGGHYVMRLAQSYGLLSEHTTRGLTVVQPVPFSPPTTISRDVIYVDDGITAVERSPFPVLRTEPSTSKKRPWVTMNPPRGLSPATMESRYLADEVKTVQKAL